MLLADGSLRHAVVTEWYEVGLPISSTEYKHLY